jgi:hypothetical protein
MIAATLLLAQIVANTPRGPVIAHDGRIELHRGWSAQGVEHATAIVTGATRVAVLDALNNEAVIADLATGKTTRMQTAETPVGGAFTGDKLFVLSREQGDFVRESNGALYVYSRMSGTLREVESDRTVKVAPFASDMEIGGRTAYLVFPREAKIRTVDLTSMYVTGSVSVGAVPVDLAFAGGGTAITARILAVADPSAKRVWLTEGTQSTMQALARGFLRGFLGLGLFGKRSSQFPTGVDRVLISGKQWIAYDSSSGTLYRFTKSKSSVIAKGIAPQAFAVSAGGVVYWKDGTLVAQKNPQ